MPTQRSRRRLAKIAAVASATLLLGGCADYLNHRDRLTLAAGDDVLRNQAVHTIDPWPPRVDDTRISSSGKRTDEAIKRYENPPAPAKATDVTVNVGTGAAAGTSAP
jgi:hypothetical protein